MNLFDGLDPKIVGWVIIPFMIFVARILDVSIGTVRIILVGKGIRFMAAVLGFFEVLIWITAISQIMNNLTNVANYLSYATGFATGTYIGMLIEQRLSIGKVIIRVITTIEEHDNLLELIVNESKVGLTTVEAEGKYGPVKIMFMVMERKEVPKIIRLINEHNPHAFYSIEDVRYVNPAKPIKGGFDPKLNMIKKSNTMRK